MARNKTTSAMVDGLLRFLAVGGLITTATLVPNALSLWDKPTQKFFSSLDKRAQQREYQRLLRYMSQQGMVTPYAHGLRLTDKGRKRAEQADLEAVSIPAPLKWDGQWRIIFFDIPEARKRMRDYFAQRLKLLGFQQLQRSVWVYPFPCREEVEIIAVAYGVHTYVTYIETSCIDASDQLQTRFDTLLRSLNTRRH